MEVNMIQTNKEKHPKLIRLPEVIRKTGFGRTWIYELIKAGNLNILNKRRIYEK